MPVPNSTELHHTQANIHHAATQKIRGLSSPECGGVRASNHLLISRLKVRFLHGSPLRSGGGDAWATSVPEPSRGTIGLDAHRRAPEVSMSTTIPPDGNPWSPPGRTTQILVGASPWGSDSPSRHQQIHALHGAAIPARAPVPTGATSVRVLCGDPCRRPPNLAESEVRYRLKTLGVRGQGSAGVTRGPGLENRYGCKPSGVRIPPPPPL